MMGILLVQAISISRTMLGTSTMMKTFGHCAHSLLTDFHVAFAILVQ